jgi:predicted RNA-binding Zn-ribbon protein involved in translation (DUF1610 family)
MADLRESLIKVIESLPKESSYDEILDAIREQKSNLVGRDSSGMVSQSSKPLACGSCGREIQKGESYTKNMLTGEVTCYRCEEGLLIKGDNLLAID